MFEEDTEAAAGCYNTIDDFNSHFNSFNFDAPRISRFIETCLSTHRHCQSLSRFMICSRSPLNHSFQSSCLA